MLHGKSKQPVISERLSKTPSSKTSIDSKRVSALVAKSIDGKTEAAKPATPAAASTQGNFLFNSKLRMKALQAGHGRFNQSMGQWELNGKHTAKPATVRTTPGAYAKPQVAGKTFHQAPTQQIPRS